MQNTTSKTRNSMTFPELYRDMSASEKRAFRLQLMQLTHCSEASIRSWVIMRRNPFPVYKINIIKALANMGIKTTEHTLFAYVD